MHSLNKAQQSHNLDFLKFHAIIFTYVLIYIWIYIYQMNSFVDTFGATFCQLLPTTVNPIESTKVTTQCNGIIQNITQTAWLKIDR